MKKLLVLKLAKNQKKTVKLIDLKFIFARFSSAFCSFTYLNIRHNICILFYYCIIKEYEGRI